MQSKTFEDWELPAEILAGVKSLGWENPTPVQLDAIPLGREGNNVIGQAMTGSGKTGAFGIPILENADVNGTLQALILCPTRELAQQVRVELEQLQGGKGLTILSVYGGTDIEKQAKKLDAGVEVIVGTPGRVMDMSKRGHIDLSSPSMLTLDEADRMLDMGFMPDIMWVVERMTGRQQTMLFSATFPQEILDAAGEFMQEHSFVQMGDAELDLPPVKLFSIIIGRANKLWALGRILIRQQESDGQTIVFTNTKRMVDMIVERLGKHRIEAVGLHGDMAQNKREKIMDIFRENKAKTIVATDVAARGLDVEGVTVVVNYDVPNDSDSFIHRMGRTGRAGREGEAWTFISRDDIPQMSRIQGTYDLDIEQVETPELPEGVERDPVRYREDYSESADVFGMIPLTFNVGSSHGASKLSIHNFLLSTVRMDELTVGKIHIGEDESEVNIHTSKVGYVIDGVKGKELFGQPLSASPA
jgi:ATP-dependent RNA helicase DeaD